MHKSGLIAGLDEVGLGALAGPIVICVAAFTKDATPIAGVKDSKKLSKKAREGLVSQIVEQAAFVQFGYASAQTIDKRGVAEAWQVAASMAITSASVSSIQKLIVDGTRSVKGFPTAIQEVQPKADSNHWQVAAASIVAKVIRDAHMAELGGHYCNYDWGQNAGYGTMKHIDACMRFGLTREHRKLFTRNIQPYPEKRWRNNTW